MDTVAYLVDRFKLDLTKPSPFWVMCNRLTDLPEMFKELGFTSGAEIGVCYGRFSELLCQSNPAMRVYSVDAWEWYPVKNNFRPRWIYPKIYREAAARLSQYPNSTIVRKWSMDAVKDFADESLDFVFIDADHRFQHITNDIAEWSKKVKHGGIISGHDFPARYRSSQFVHVRPVVEAWTMVYQIHPWLVLNDHLERSWLWVNP